MKTYSIDEIAGRSVDVWQEAILNVITALNSTMGTKLTYVRNRYDVDRLADALNIRFDESGRIISSELTA